jgi:hypothetical protein
LPVILAQARIHVVDGDGAADWTPAFAGVTAWAGRSIVFPVILAQARIHVVDGDGGADWTPAFAGVTARAGRPIVFRSSWRRPGSMSPMAMMLQTGHRPAPA